MLIELTEVMNKFEKRRERDRNRGIEDPCPKCGASPNQPCRNLSPRAQRWQTWILGTHKERYEQRAMLKEKG